MTEAEYVMAALAEFRAIKKAATAAVPVSNSEPDTGSEKKQDPGKTPGQGDVIVIDDDGDDEEIIFMGSSSAPVSPAKPLRRERETNREREPKPESGVSKASPPKAKRRKKAKDASPAMRRGAKVVTCLNDVDQSFLQDSVRFLCLENTAPFEDEPQKQRRASPVSCSKSTTP